MTPWQKEMNRLEGLARNHVLMFAHRVDFIDFPTSNKVILQCHDCDEPLAQMDKEDFALHEDIGKYRAAKTAKVRKK